jgi:hypothetical protein
MATLCKTYSTPDAARRAVEALTIAGVPARDIRLLTGGVFHDIRREPVGGFAGTIGPEAHVGDYGGALRLRRQGRGAYAGDPDGQRQGSFADTDRDMIVTGDGRSHAAGDDAVRMLLEAAAMVDDAVEHVVGDLHRGCAVVLAEIAEIRPGEAQARLEELAG